MRISQAKNQKKSNLDPVRKKLAHRENRKASDGWNMRE
jgi:hypothetical protein